MYLQAVFGAVGLWAGIQALRISWVPRLTQMATAAVLVSGFLVFQALVAPLVRLTAIA
jgi:hypothetical protein